jgi:hypothetical protein
MSLDPSHRGILLRSPIARAIHFGRFAFFSARFFGASNMARRLGGPD